MASGYPKTGITVTFLYKTFLQTLHKPYLDDMVISSGINH